MNGDAEARLELVKQEMNIATSNSENVGSEAPNTGNEITDLLLRLCVVAGDDDEDEEDVDTDDEEAVAEEINGHWLQDDNISSTKTQDGMVEYLALFHRARRTI